MRLLPAVFIAICLLAVAFATPKEASANCSYNVLGERVCSDSGLSNKAWGGSSDLSRSYERRQAAEDRAEAQRRRDRQREDDRLMRRIEQEQRGTSSWNNQPTTNLHCKANDRRMLCQ